MTQEPPQSPPEDDAPTRVRVADARASPKPQPSGDPGRSVFWPGEVVASRFRIVRFLAKGGMGELYEAEDLELHERIALKTILSRIADERSIQMFKREVHLARQVTHPNVCRIFDVFRHRPQAAAGAEGDAAEVVVLAMEFLNGETLADRLLREGRLTIAEALPLARQMASGLTAAHRAGVVHRDFKSLNVMLVKPGSPDGELRAVITDFGLAKRNSEDDRSNLSVSLNDAGEISGTPAYMSPEQVEGGAVTPATDVYAMGVVLFEMVTGARPFVADTPLKIAVKRLQEAAPSARIHVPDLDARWEAVIRRCLARQPADRFSSPDEAVAALSDTSSRLTKPGGMAVPQTRTRKAIIGAVAVVALAVAVGALLRWPLKLGGGAGSVKRVAVLPFENLGSPEDDYFADGVADEIRGKLTSLRGLLVIARGSSTPYKKTTKTPQQIAEELHASYLLSATVRWDKSAGKSRVHVSPELVDVTDPQTPASKWQQPFVAALTDVFQVQSDIASRAARELGVVLGVSEEKRLAEKPTQNLAAYDAFLKGEETSNAMAANDPPSVRKALTSYEQAVALDPAFGQAWARISLANSTLFANVAPTPALAEHARQAAERAVALAPDRPEPYLAFGFYERFVRHDSDRALERFGKGLSVAPGNADLLTGTARAEQALGRWDAAVEHFKEAERSDPRSAITLRRLGTALLLLRRYPEAREALAQGLAIAPTDLSMIESKAMTFLGEGNLAGARQVLGAAPAGIEPEALVAYAANYFGLVWALDEQQREVLLRLTASAFDDDRGNWSMALVDVFVLKGDAPNLRIHADEARKALEEQVRVAPQEAGGHVSLGLALAYLGRKREAIEEGERGVALSPISKDAVSGPYYQHQLVRIYTVVGEPEKALDHLEPLLKIPYLLSPGWLKIDPNFDALRGSPRFQKLVAGAK